jgi:hypothetical protein
MMGWVLACAVLCAFPRFWMAACGVAMPIYLMLALVALVDAASRVAVAPRPRLVLNPLMLVWSPVRLLNPRELIAGSGWIRLISLALGTATILVVGAAFWIFLACGLVGGVTHPILGPALLPLSLRDMLGELVYRGNWTYRGAGELFRLPRSALVLATAAVAAAVSPGGGIDWRRAGRSLLVLSPWLLVLEVGHLAGTWAARWDVGLTPEPENHFGRADCFGLYALRFFLIADGPASFAVGLANFRGIAGWRWKAAIVGTVGLSLFGVVLSMVWFSWDLNPWLRWYSRTGWFPH